MAGSQNRGLSGWWFSPIAQAPRRAASRASSRFVTPQNLTLMPQGYAEASRAWPAGHGQVEGKGWVDKGAARDHRLAGRLATNVV